MSPSISITQLITIPRPERDFSLEEKMESRCAGACEVETSGGCVDAYERMETTVRSILRLVGKKELQSRKGY